MYGPTAYGLGSPPTHNSSPLNDQQRQQQHQHPGQQRPQHLMYNPQAYGAPPQQPPMYDGSGSGLGGNADSMAMPPQQDGGGRAHLPAGDAHYHYQTPYTSSPYGVSIPSASSTLPSNYLPTSAPRNAPPSPFPMNPQLMNQRPLPSSAATRASPYGSMQSAPPNASAASSQFATSQPFAHGAGAQVTTPQTPIFPPSQQGQTAQANPQMATPLSPGGESREKERVTLLLEINRELLMAVIELQNAQQAEKKEELASANTTPTEEKDKAEKEKAEKGKAASGREYVECMRRLQSNLAYLAAIADRAHKPSSQIPPHPAIMSAPPMASHLNPAGDAEKPDSESSEPKKDGGEARKETKIESKSGTGESRQERIETLEEQYKSLQALFPGADPKKDPPIQRISEASRQQMQAKAQAQAQAIAQAQAAASGQGGQGGQGQAG